MIQNNFNLFFYFIMILYLLLFLLLFIVILLLVKNINNISTLNIKYFFNKIYKKIIGENINKTNQISQINKTRQINKILIISCDNRPELEYIKLHNKSFEKYTRNNPDVDYIFYRDCGKENIYWSRLFLIRNLLLQNKYDWIGWIDSDTMIKNYNFDIKKDLITKYNNYDILIADDNQFITEGVNSGIFFIKNSEIGFNFIVDTINQYKKNKKCRDSSNNLLGMFAGICYEQAQMELQIQSKYKNNTFIIPKDIVLCTTKDITINNNTINNQSYPFIYHLISTNTDKRNKIFKKIDTKNQ
jgi:hypothetical protein